MTIFLTEEKRARMPKKRKKSLLLPFLGTIALICVAVISAKNLPASFSNDTSRTFVEIDGVQYGSFDNVSGLNGLQSQLNADGESFLKVSLKRSFVTDPSLYLWAKNTTTQRNGQKDVNIIVENNDGQEVARYVLKLCQPLSWTVESANSALGGFHETVDLAVQDIAVY